MSLIKCNECGKDISASAKKCPSCGEPTEYSKKNNKKVIIAVGVILAIIIGIIICDKSAILKKCDDGDEKRGSICIKKHYSDAKGEYVCPAMHYIKDGNCYHNSTGSKGLPPHKEYHCDSGYLEEDYIQKRCVVETTYNAYYKFGTAEE